MIITRAKHMMWSKERALEHVEMGDLIRAFASMASDLGKHPETRNHPATTTGFLMMNSGKLSTKNEMRKFIEGFS